MIVLIQGLNKANVYRFVKQMDNLIAYAELYLLFALKKSNVSKMHSMENV